MSVESMYKNVRISRKLINLTKQTIHVYEMSSGAILEILPSKKKLPELPAKVLNGQCADYYILDKKEADRLRLTGRPMNDVAVIRDTAIGRGGKEIAKLVWGVDPNIMVEVCSNTYLMYV